MWTSDRFEKQPYPNHRSVSATVHDRRRREDACRRHPLRQLSCVVLVFMPLA
jgi:hypothetical protein